MDHLLDYGFLCSILIGYSFLIQQKSIFNMRRQRAHRANPHQYFAHQVGHTWLERRIAMGCFWRRYRLALLAYVAQRKLWQTAMEAKAEAVESRPLID